MKKDKLLFMIITVFLPVIFFKDVLSPVGYTFFKYLFSTRWPVYDWFFKQGASAVSLWMPNTFCGFPVLAEVKYSLTFPVVAAVFKFFPPQTALAIILLFIFISAFGFTFLYARRAGLGRVSSIYASAIFSLSGFMLSIPFAINSLVTVATFPLVLYLLDKAFSPVTENERTSGKYAVFTGMALGLQFLSGGLEFYSYMLPVYAGYSIFKGRPFGSRFFATCMISAVIALGIAAVQLIPTTELIQHSARRYTVSELGHSVPGG